MSTGKGIAITGVWISVAISAFAIGAFVILLGVCATVATFFIVEADKPKQ